MPENGFQHLEIEPTRAALLLQIAALESKMAQTRALLDEQSKERQQLYSKINTLSPIDQLPPEIKSEIFYNALQRPLNGEGENPLVVTPFFLGKICRGWRDFVWSSPVLWTNLHLCLSTDKHEAQTNLLRDWLSRTAKCPLSFWLTTVEPAEAWISDPPIEILSMFASVSAQWKEAEFFLPDTRECFDAISAAESSLPLLTTSTARWLTRDSSIPRHLNLFSTAPQLSALHLCTLYLFTVPAPWHQLREFTSETNTIDEIRGLLNRVPNVIRCSFIDIVSSILDDSWDFDIFDRLPVLEHLEYLELRFNSINSDATQLLGPSKLPSLREVCLRSPFADSWAFLPQIMTSFQSSHLLEKFTFGGIMDSYYNLVQVLENIPSVKDLYLDFHDQEPSNELLTKTLLRRLYPPHADILLPNLRSFTYDGPTSLNEDIHLFRDMLVYRFRQCALRPTGSRSEQRTCQIQSITVMTSSKLVISPAILRELDGLVQEGLVLSLTSTSLPENPGPE